MRRSLPSFILLISFLVVLAGCESGPAKSGVTESGINYEFIVKNAEGKKPADRDYLLLNLSYKDKNDSTYYTSVNADPVIIPYTDSIPFKGSYEEMSLMMNEGDSLAFDVNAQTLFEKTFGVRMPTGVTEEDKFSFNVGVVQVMNEEEFVAFSEEWRAKKRVEYEMMEAEQYKTDSLILVSYVADNKISGVKFTDSGLGYKFLKSRKGTNATAADFVHTHYIGKHLDGTVFDQSDPSVGPSSFRVNGVIRGWTEALKMMSAGDKLELYVPSKLAYGPQGNGPAIPPNSNLIFEVELVKIDPK